MRHKYAVGQMVDLISAPGVSNRPSGPCRILVAMPFEGRHLQYRVQADAEKMQRVVNETDLRPSDAVARVAEEARAVFTSIAITRR